MIRKALKTDLKPIASLAEKTRNHMISTGLLQWTGNYPAYENFLSDYENEGLYLFEDDGKIIASVTILPENDKPYKELRWLRNKSLVIHRIFVDPEVQKKGIGKSLFEHAIKLANEGDYDSIKIDTHPDNLKMQRLIEKTGFKYIGWLTSIYRMAYELVIK